MNECYITIYTEQNILTFGVRSTVDNAQQKIAEAFEGGDMLILDTTDNNVLAINSVNIIAAEISITPPGQQFF